MVGREEQRGHRPGEGYGVARIPRRCLRGLAVIAAVLLLPVVAVLVGGSKALATASLTPGQVSTFAGSGSSTPSDGVGTAAGFAGLQGVVVTGGVAYVTSTSAVRAVNLSTAQVSTLSGSLTVQGCVDSTDHTVVRFQGLSSIATDGSNLYVSTNTCGIQRVTISSGAASALVTNFNNYSLAFGSDGYLYGLAPGGSTIYQINPSTGAYLTYLTLPTVSGYTVSADYIAADTGNLWVTSTYGNDTALWDITMGSPPSATVVQAQNQTIGQLGYFDGPVTSVGGYLYLGSVPYGAASPYLTPPGSQVMSYTKSTGQLVGVAGVDAMGYQNGTGTDAWFNNIAGIASDGTNLWVADGSNNRLREITPGSPLPEALPATYTTTLNIPVGQVRTFAGSGSSTASNDYGVKAGFADLNGGVAFTGGVAYVASASGAIRAVSLSTGQVWTFAGSNTNPGCQDATNPNAALFGNEGSITTDGYYLYVLQPLDDTNYCGGIRRVSIATGATSELGYNGGNAYITVGSDGFIYALEGTPIAGPAVMRLVVVVG